MVENRLIVTLVLLTCHLPQLSAYPSLDDEPDTLEISQRSKVTRSQLPVYSPAMQTRDEEFMFASGEGASSAVVDDSTVTYSSTSSIVTYVTDADDLLTKEDISTSKSAEYDGSTVESTTDRLVKSIVTQSHSKPLPLEKTTLQADSAISSTNNTVGAEQLPTIQSVLSLISNQQEVLLDLKAHLSRVNSRLDAQQDAIDRHEQVLDEHSWKMADISRNQIQATNDLHSLNSAINDHRHQPITTQSSSEDTKISTVKLASLTDEVHTIDNRVTQVEEIQTNLASVLQHLISDKVWETGYYNRSVSQSEHSHQSTSANQSESELTGQPISEADAQKVEERTNQLLSSVENWNKVEQILHTSLSDLHTDHRRYDEVISFLTNYTLNNAVVISQLAEARLDDGASIMILMNSSTWLSQQVYMLKAAVRENKNMTGEMLYQTERNLDQLLQLIELNSLKIITLQDALRQQGSLFESHLNYTTIQLLDLERSLNSLGTTHNSSLSIVTEKLQSNKEKSDMLWSRFRILDNRLAHVEVKYLTEELNKYQKSNDDLRQSLKLMEIENQLETITTNIGIQQTNHESMYKKLNSVEGKVEALSSSVESMESDWTEFSDSLPKLDIMYKEVEMMINVLPRDCDDVYNRGIHNSGPQLAKPDSNHSAVELLCDIDTVGERGWTVVQQRFNGQEDFNRNWTEYRNGFGRVDFGEEFWAGNELMHTLTSKFNYTIQFDMWTTNNTYVYATYDKFELLSESEGYRLQVSGYSGNATDSLKHSNGSSFSTIDVDNDMSSTDCAQFYTAGWWYKHCHYCNLNGRYTVGIVWFNHLIDDWMELKRTTVRISRHR